MRFPWEEARRGRRQSRLYDNFDVAAFCELVAQLVEQRPFKAWVLGSSPSGLTTPFGRFPLLVDGYLPDEPIPGL
jgi:hypothetical protein